MIDNIFKVVLDLSISASFLILIVLILRPLAKLKFAPKFRVYLWIMVIIKLMLPFNFSTSFSVYNLLPDINPTGYTYQNIDTAPINEADNSFIDNYYGNGTSFDNTIYPIEDNLNLNITDSNISSDNESTVIIDNSIDSMPKANNNVKWIITESFFNILSLIWIIGFVSLLTVYLIINLLFYMRVKALPFSVSSTAKQYINLWSAKLNIKYEIRVKETSLVKVPAVYGFIRPILLFPRGIENSIGDEELSAIVLHELSHIKRKDTVLGIVSLFTKFVHWFNPFVWYGFSLLKNDIEASCDSMVLNSLDTDKHKAYGMTLLKLSSQSPREISLLGMTGILEGKKKIKDRIKEITLFKKKGYTVSIGAAVILLAIGIFFLSGAMDKNAAKENGDNANVNTSKETVASPEINENTNNDEKFSSIIDLDDYDLLSKYPNRPIIDDDKLISLKNWLNSYINSLDSMDQAVYKALQSINLSSKEVPNYITWHEFGRKVDGNKLSLFVWAYTVDCKDLLASLNIPVRIDMIKTSSDKYIVLDTHVASKFSYYANDLNKIMEEFSDDIMDIHNTDIIKNLNEKVLELDKKALEAIEKENIPANDQGIYIDGYLSELTQKGKFDSASIRISGDAIKSYLQASNRRYIPIYQSNDTDLIKDVFEIINDESLWGEFVDGTGSASGQLNDIVNLSLSLVFNSKEGMVYIGLNINPENRKMYAECIWHRTGSGKTVKLLSCEDTNLYPILVKKIFDINIDSYWRLSGNLDRKYFACYSIKDSYSINETLYINAIFDNTEGQIESSTQNISGWLKMSNEKDVLSWDNIKVELPIENSTLLQKNIIKVNLENSGIKPGIYTIEGKLGDYTINKFEVEIKGL